MRDKLGALIGSVDKTEEQLLSGMQGIFSAARASAVYGEPQQVGDQMLITVSEVSAGGGFGFGRGIGTASEEETATDSDGVSAGGGGGGGGGGGSTARPVAVILVGPDGVKVKPVVDVTKIALAAITAWGVMIPTLVRIARASRH